MKAKSKKSLLSLYHELEANNDHSEAALLLVKHMGTPDEIEAMQGILNMHNMRGYIITEDMVRRRNISQKYYKALTLSTTAR